MMPAKGRLQVMILEHLEHSLRIERPLIDLFIERKMRKRDGRLRFADLLQRLTNEPDCRLLDVRFVRAQSFRAVEADKLPAFVLEIIIEAVWEHRVVRLAICLSDVIMIPRQHEQRHAQTAKYLLHRSKLRFPVVMCKITPEEAQIGVCA